MTKSFHPVANIFPLIEGDEFEAFCADVRNSGLRMPIVLHPDGRILDGRNRYRACLATGIEPRFEQWDGPVGTEVAFVLSCNIHRRNLDESQRATVANEVATLERGRPGNTEISVFTQEQAAKALNVSVDSVQFARRVKEQGIPELYDAVRNGRIAVSAAAALTRQPEDFQEKVVEKVNAGAKSTDAIREVRREELVEQLEDVAAREAEAPTGMYDVIVIDPPWPMEKIEREVTPHQVEFDYPTMDEDELAAMSIPADNDCHVWLWTTHKFLPMALRLLDAWELKYVCTFVWHKPGGFQPFGLPQYNCEFALYARKGAPKFIDVKSFNTCFDAPRGKHSEKPEEFYDVVRRVTAGRRLDMFNRRLIDGFVGWGKEAACA